MTGSRAGLVWTLGALSFGYAFFQRVMPSVMVEDLMRDLSVGAAVLGNLAAMYLYVYAGLQIPIGMLLDRLGPRLMLTAGAAIAACGSLLFGLAQSIGMAYAGRLLVGMGCAVGFVGTLKLTAHWFPSNRYAFLGGMAMLVGMAGGVGGQGPLALVIESTGWRATAVGAGGGAILLAIATWWLVRDRPPGQPAPPRSTRGARGILADLREVLTNRNVLLLALYGGCMSGPMLAYAGLWGVPHMMQAHDLSRPAAAASASLVLIGWAVGSPLGGWISDHIGRRRRPMGIAALLALCGWLGLLYLPGLPLPMIWVLLFGTGAASGAMVICMALARELVPSRVSGAVTGFVNTFNVGGGAAFQPLIGMLLDRNWDGVMLAGARVYSVEAYASAFVILPLCSLTAMTAALMVRESYCRPLPE